MNKVITKTNHTHKYQRTRLSKRSSIIVFRCMLPGCNHYVHPPFLLNKLSICWSCNEPFVIGPKAASRKKPKCNNCIKTKGRRDGYSRKGFEPPRTNGRFEKLRREIEEVLEEET